MSTILDALRKAQAKHEEEEAGALADRDAGYVEPAADVARNADPDDLDNFDDLDRPARRSAVATPGRLAAVGVGLIGLALGVAAAGMVSGNLPFFGGSEETIELAERDTPRAQPPAEDDSKKSSPLADVTEPAEVDKRAPRESRNRSTRSLKVERTQPASPQAEAPVADAGAPPAAQPALEPGAPPVAVAPSAPPGAVAPTDVPQPVAPGQLAAPPQAGQAPLPATASLPAAAVPPPVVAAQPNAAVSPPIVAGQPGALPPPVQVAAVEPQGAAPGMPVPGEPSAGTVLELPPSGAPEVSLLFIKWSRDVHGRVASLRGPGGKLMLVHEGDIVEGMRVSAIRADAVELQWRGTNFLLYAAR